MRRGDVVLVRFLHPSGLRGKKWPAVVVQADAYAGRLAAVVVAEVTSNLSMVADLACLFIAAGTADGHDRDVHGHRRYRPPVTGGNG